MASTNQQNKRLFFVTFGHFETNPDKIDPGTFTVGADTYPLPQPHIIYTDSESFKKALTEVVEQYERMLQDDERNK